MKFAFQKNWFQKKLYQNIKHIGEWKLFGIKKFQHIVRNFTDQRDKK